MDSKEIKKVVQQTEKELKEEDKEKQIKKVKEIVKRTLEAIEKTKSEKSVVDKRLKYLKMDLDDLKEGRLDRIEERQVKDPEAKKTSVIVIIKEKEVIREREVPYPVYPSPWYWPYNITWQYPYWWTNTGGSSITFDTVDDNGIKEIGNQDVVAFPSSCCNTHNNTNGISINCSVAKD